MPAVGSSSSSSCGSVASARATSSFRWSPYGRFLAASCALRRRPTSWRSSSARARAAASSRFTNGVRMIELKRFACMRECMPTSTFSSAVMFWNRRMFWKVRPMPRDGDRVRRLAGDVLAEEHDRPGRRLVDAGEHVEERRLAGAVRPDQRDHLAARHGEVDVVHRDEAAELLAHVLRDEEVAVVVVSVMPPLRASTSYSGSSWTPSCSSAARRLDGIRPSGRKSITTQDDHPVDAGRVERHVDVRVPMPDVDVRVDPRRRCSRAPPGRGRRGTPRRR